MKRMVLASIIRHGPGGSYHEFILGGDAQKLLQEVPNRNNTRARIMVSVYFVDYKHMKRCMLLAFRYKYKDYFAAFGKIVG